MNLYTKIMLALSTSTFIFNIIVIMSYRLRLTNKIIFSSLIWALINIFIYFAAIKISLQAFSETVIENMFIFALVFISIFLSFIVNRLLSSDKMVRILTLIILTFNIISFIIIPSWISSNLGWVTGELLIRGVFYVGIQIGYIVLTIINLILVASKLILNTLK